MKTKNMILIGLLILVGSGLIFAAIGFPKGNLTTKESKTATKSGDTDYGPASTGSTSIGDVLVELTPLGVVNNRLEVAIAVNTHSVNLGKFDLKQITTLHYNDKSIKPVSTPRLGGHHSSGTLIFDVSEDVNSFTIKIKGIPKVEERIFKWE
jgi:hypothetical protein